MTNGNILNIDPLFINTAAGNFNLSKNSFANKKGFDLSQDFYFGTFLSKDLNYKEGIVKLQNQYPDLSHELLVALEGF